LDILRRKSARAEFERFVTNHADGLLRTGYLITWDLAEAEDLVQECLLRLAKRWPKVRGMEHPEAYARRVLVNLAIDGSVRRRRRERELQRVDDVPVDEQGLTGIEDCFGVHETRAELLEAIGTLPPRQRAVLVLRFFEDLSEAQVADALGCSRGTVKSTTSRGLSRLRKALEAGEVLLEAGAIGPGHGNPQPREGDQIDDRAT
jgi:RNA polymerase sigma-70 factor (sigma-E family)